MFKGFYNLTSGMLSQGHRLDVISNNMTNISTAGFKSDRYTDSTFAEYMIHLVGNKDKSNSLELGPSSYILAPSAVYTNYTQGALEETGMTLDFAIEGDGFFAIDTADGVAYTRAGNFSLDEEGYLCLPGQGRVLDSTGQPILLISDQFTADSYGGLYDERGGLIAQLGVYTFPDNGALTRNDQGMFTDNGLAQATATPIRWKTLERSNVDLVQQMVEMITSQRALQSAAQLTKMYDQLMTKATNDLGRI